MFYIFEISQEFQKKKKNHESYAYKFKISHLVYFLFFTSKSITLLYLVYIKIKQNYKKTSLSVGPLKVCR